MTSTPYNTTTANSGPITIPYQDGTTLDNCTIGATTAAPATVTNLTISGTMTRTGGSVVAPVASGTTLTLTSSSYGKTINLNNVAGCTVTLPAATGSGGTYKFIVTATTTSAAIKVLAASTADFMNGIAIGYTGSTAKVFSSAASTNHAIQMPFAGSQPSGGFIGDVIVITDIAANLWNAEIVYQAGTTPTTPFSGTNT